MSEPLESTTKRALPGARPVPFQGRDEVALGDDGGDFPDALERGHSPRTGAWVKVPGSALERMSRRDVTALWRGERVAVDLVDETAAVAGFWFTGDRAWALENGLQGSQHDGGYAARLRSGSSPT